ncbi:hypothetical protein C8R41DRAFT_915965 [Lentinula lateritia]|uniref:DUF6534 domain-containing protein n=1 Tax=Lentinula lateritia TaxID=40482 RepID=A0ABQ8VR46_9AGAR|nr:hypothetical protein C8R41DRAFT_915965 [Lentinula lateritia]
MYVHYKLPNKPHTSDGHVRSTEVVISSGTKTRAKILSVTVNILSAISNVAIAGTLSIYFQKNKNGFHSTTTILNILILFAINTGAITTSATFPTKSHLNILLMFPLSICAISSLIIVLVAPDTLIYISFFFCIGRVHTISLLATLNARKMILRKSRQDADITTRPTSPLVFQDFGTHNTIKTQHDGVSTRITTNRRTIDSDALCHTIGHRSGLYELQKLSTTNFHSTYMNSTSVVNTNMPALPSNAHFDTTR